MEQDASNGATAINQWGMATCGVSPVSLAYDQLVLFLIRAGQVVPLKLSFISTRLVQAGRARTFLSRSHASPRHLCQKNIATSLCRSTFDITFFLPYAYPYNALRMKTIAPVSLEWATTSSTSWPFWRRCFGEATFLYRRHGQGRRGSALGWLMCTDAAALDLLCKDNFMG